MYHTWQVPEFWDFWPGIIKFIRRYMDLASAQPIKTSFHTNNSPICLSFFDSILFHVRRTTNDANTLDKPNISLIFFYLQFLLDARNWKYHDFGRRSVHFAADHPYKNTANYAQYLNLPYRRLISLILSAVFWQISVYIRISIRRTPPRSFSFTFLSFTISRPDKHSSSWLSPKMMAFEIAFHRRT